jgi:peptidyl-prolyl cis-trans isomerase B (cyclophilin B)
MPSQYVLMETSLGSIKLELDEDKAPISVKNFLSYVDKKFYDNTIFHRVINGFMIQGGGFEPGMRQKATDPPIKNESGNGLSNVRGSLAMARTSDLNSATAQFYINVADNSRSLDQPKYCVFGKVADKASLDVVDKIKAVRTGQKGHHGDVPVEDVVINSIRRAQA